MHHVPPDRHHETILEVEAPRVKFGRGAIDEVGAEAAALGLRRIALFTDRHLAPSAFVARARASLRAAGVDVAEFAEVRIEPTDASFGAAAAFALEARVDGYVSVGGGSTIDTAKAANLYATYPAPFERYVNAPLGEGAPVPGSLAPHIACGQARQHARNAIQSVEPEHFLAQIDFFVEIAPECRHHDVDTVCGELWLKTAALEELESVAEADDARRCISELRPAQTKCDGLRRNGNDVDAIDRAYDEAMNQREQPTGLSAKQEKGHGVSQIANKDGWNGKALPPDMEKAALAELGDIRFGQRVGAGGHDDGVKGGLGGQAEGRKNSWAGRHMHS